MFFSFLCVCVCVISQALTFYNCNNLRVADLSLKDAQQMHLIFHGCENVRATNIRITAPESSPNTDGIHVTGTRNILIDNCLIETGDRSLSPLECVVSCRVSGTLIDDLNKNFPVHSRRRLCVDREWLQVR